MSKPKVIATLLVRDEQDIVLNCIEHHLKHGVDGFIITDNMSRDATGEICRKHPACLHYKVEHDPRFSNRARWVTQMARYAVNLGADWILNLDADEFWYGADKLGDLPADVNEVVIRKKRLHILTQDVEYGAFSRHFTPYCIPPDPRRANKGKTMHRAHKLITVHYGNHRVKGPWGSQGVITDRALPDFFFHHYSDRSYRRWTLKCRNAGAKVGGRLLNLARHWDRAWHAHLNHETKQAYARKIYTQAQLDAGLAAGKIERFVPTDELPLDELKQRSGF